MTTLIAALFLSHCVDLLLNFPVTHRLAGMGAKLPRGLEKIFPVQLTNFAGNQICQPFRLQKTIFTGFFDHGFG